jgi:hypothetical protein
VDTRIKEHRRHFRLCQPEKSAVAEHSINNDHTILWDKARILCRANHFWERLTKEAIEIRLEKKNFNRDQGYNLSTSWKPILKLINKEREKKNAGKPNQSTATGLCR